MTKQAQFYLIETVQPQGELSAVEVQACNLAAQAWRLGKRVLIACETEEQAFRLDEALWQRDADEFVPHNLSGEVTNSATPIEISWLGKRNAQRRDILISLRHKIPDFVAGFNHVIDFVPTDESEKAVARERYKQYRQMGWQLSTENV